MSSVVLLGGLPYGVMGTQLRRSQSVYAKSASVALSSTGLLSDDVCMCSAKPKLFTEARRIHDCGQALKMCAGICAGLLLHSFSHVVRDSCAPY